jgi:hypothetical protein
MKAHMAPAAPPRRARDERARWRSSVLAISAFAAILAAGAAAGARLADGPPAERPETMPPPAPTFDVALDVSAFDRGNLHTHSIESDGDATPEEVYRFYRDHDYQFVALTDHNHFVDPKTYRWLEKPRFKIIAGEEITMSAEGKEIHVNALCIDHKILGGTFDTKKQALEHAIDLTARQGGVALINHPNFGAALDLGDLLDGGRHAALLEIWSGHPYVYSAGVDGRPSHEALWEAALSRGMTFAAVGVDDAHHFKAPPLSGKAAAPARAWIATYSEPGAPVDVDATCDKIRRGAFYASSGARIERLRVQGSALDVWPADPGATVTFLGVSGRVLGKHRADETGRAHYELARGEPWVRARIDTPSGKRAWTQPFRVTH